MNSRTWSKFIENLSRKYGLPDPLSCLKTDPPEKAEYKEVILTKIAAYHEKEMRNLSKNNSRMKYLNTSVLGLRGRQHPCLSNILTTHEVKKARPHIKMLAGDYFTYSIKASQSGGSPHCRTCNVDENTIEDTMHMISVCSAYANIRSRIIDQFREFLNKNINSFDFESVVQDNELFCQFVLDPCSMNLASRINIADPSLAELFQLSRDLCYGIHSKRLEILKEKS